jgi:phosphoglycolate phosphatase-like HAD superfamily hydrolase
MVGNSKNDIAAGINAGCYTAYLTDTTNKQQYIEELHCVLVCKDLLDFVNTFLEPWWEE